MSIKVRSKVVILGFCWLVGAGVQARAGVNQDLAAMLRPDTEGLSKTEMQDVASRLRQMAKDPSANPQLAEQAVFRARMLEIQLGAAGDNQYVALWNEAGTSSQRAFLRGEIVFSLETQLRRGAGTPEDELKGKAAQMRTILLSVMEGGESTSGLDTWGLISLLSDVDPRGTLDLLDRLDEKNILWRPSNLAMVHRWFYLKQRFGEARYEHVAKIMRTFPVQAHLFVGLFDLVLISSRPTSAQLEELLGAWEADTRKIAEGFKDAKLQQVLLDAHECASEGIRATILDSGKPSIKALADRQFFGKIPGYVSTLIQSLPPGFAPSDNPFVLQGENQVFAIAWLCVIDQSLIQHADVLREECSALGKAKTTTDPGQKAAAEQHRETLRSVAPSLIQGLGVVHEYLTKQGSVSSSSAAQSTHKLIDEITNCT